MGVQHVGQTEVLLAAVEFLCKLEKAHRHLVVKVQKLAVLADHVEDDFADLDKEQDLGQDPVLLLELLQIAIGQKNQLFWGRVALLDHDLVRVRVQITVGEKLREFLDTLTLFNLGHNAVVLLDEVLEDTLEEGHASMLADVAEERNVLTYGSCVGCLDANVDQSHLLAR